MLSIQPPSTPAHWSAINDLYLASFPPEERRPFDDIISRHSDPADPLSLLMIVSDGRMAGMISWWALEGLAYIEHFAVSPSMRGAGIGSQALSSFTSSLSVPVVLEVERRGANPMADRRIEFYRRNGFTPLSGYDYIQPPYSPSLPPVPLLLMSTDPSVSPEKIAAILHSEIYGVAPDVF